MRFRALDPETAEARYPAIGDGRDFSSIFSTARCVCFWKKKGIYINHWKSCLPSFEKRSHP